MAVQSRATIFTTMVKSNKFKEFIAFCLGLLFIAMLLQAGGALHENSVVFPSLQEIGNSFVRLLSQRETYTAAGISLLHLLEALAWAMLFGILAGTVEGLSNLFRSALKPVMIMIRSLPMIILVILTMTILPYSRVPVAAGTVVLIPMISEAVSEGFRSIDPEFIDVYRINGRFGCRVFFQVYIPLVSGYLKEAFFNAAGMGLKIVVSAEYLVQTRNSLGKAVYSSAYFLDYADIYAYALIMIFMVVMITGLPMLVFSARNKLHPVQKQEISRKV